MTVVYGVLVILNIMMFLNITFPINCEGWGCAVIGIAIIITYIIAFALLIIGLFIKHKTRLVWILIIINIIPLIHFVILEVKSNTKQQEYSKILIEHNRLKNNPPLKINTINTNLYKKKSGCVYRLEVIVNTTITKSGDYTISVELEDKKGEYISVENKNITKIGDYSFSITFDNKKFGLKYPDSTYESPIYLDYVPVSISYIYSFIHKNGTIQLEEKKNPAVISEKRPAFCKREE